MNPRELVAALVFAGAVLFAIAWMVRRAAAADDLERRRLDLLEKSLQHPGLDEATRAELLRALARRDARAAPLLDRLSRHAGLLRAFWFGVSWTVFLVASGVLAAHALDLVHGVRVETVLPVAILGFAMLTLPLARAELARRDPATVRR
jgi:hypothetical protein